MEEMLVSLERQRAEQLAALLAASSIDAQRIDSLKRVFEELELVAAAATPADAASGSRNPNPNVLTADFYATYLLVTLLSKNLYVSGHGLEYRLRFGMIELTVYAWKWSQQRRAVPVEAH